MALLMGSRISDLGSHIAYRKKMASAHCRRVVFAHTRVGAFRLVYNGNMDKSEGEMKTDAKLEQLGISVKVVKRLGELNDFESKLRGEMRWNVLDTRQNERNEGSFMQRKEAIDKVRQSLKGPGEEDLELVAEKNGKVIGFISIKKKDGIASVQHMWAGVASYSQKPIIAKLIDGALDELQKGSTQYPKLHIKMSSPSIDLLVICGDPARARQLVIEKDD